MSTDPAAPRVAQPKSRGQRVFEAALVVLFLVVVTALVLPVIHSERSGPGSPCASKLHALSVAARLYVEDHDGRYPNAAVWMDCLGTYFREKDAFRCPELEASATEQYSYAMNSALSDRAVGDAKPIPVLAFESEENRRNANDPLVSFAAPARHQGSGNAVRVDGSVARYSLDEWRSLRRSGELR